MKVDQFNSPPGDYTIYDLIQEFEISLYFGTILLIIGLFTVLLMVVKCSMNSICIAAKSFVLRHVWVIGSGRIIQINSEQSVDFNNMINISITKTLLSWKPFYMHWFVIYLITFSIRLNRQIMEQHMMDWKWQINTLCSSNCDTRGYITASGAMEAGVINQHSTWLGQCTVMESRLNVRNIGQKSSLSDDRNVYQWWITSFGNSFFQTLMFTSHVPVTLAEKNVRIATELRKVETT